MGTPRRLSLGFLRSERVSLETWRASVREKHRLMTIEAIKNAPPPSLGGSGDRLPANLFSRTEPAEQGCARAAAATRPPELRALVAVVRHGRPHFGAEAA